LGAFHYSAVIGDADQPAFSEQLARYWAAGFRDFKVKLSGQHRRDHAKFAALRERDDGSMRLRADANNLWRDPMECIAYLESLNCPLFALEEPLCAADLDGLKLVAEALGTKIVLDESFLRKSDFTSLRSAPSFWILNCRVSKQGGVIRTLDAVADANSLGIALIVGAHVGETSLLSRTALTVAQSAGAQLLAQEGAFGTLLLAEDLFRPCIAFGPAGRLRIPDDLPLAPHGWGLDLGEGVEI
jgi:L-alanine-DL-glutamate epimerase-like enolase superfamily enzyme